MNVLWSRRFSARYRRLSRADREAVIETIEAFRDNPLSSSFSNHALRGTMTGKRAIAVDDDLRLIFKVKGNYDEILLLDIGAHSEVYRE
jgi:addiction module RelE/StbE family toxin